jgi:hypothetical protein
MAQNLSGLKANFVTNLVSAVTANLDSIDDLISLRNRYDALGMSPGSGSPYEITAGDLAGDNNHLTPQEIADAFASYDALKALLLQGHLTNLNKLRRA